MSDHLAEKIRGHVERLCENVDRDLGTSRNRAATSHVLEAMDAAGLRTEHLEFQVPEWRYGAASVRMAGVTRDAHPGPYSAPVEVAGPLLAITRPEQLKGLDARGSILLMHGDIAAIQLTPRDYPFYSNPEHAWILEMLETASPLAVLAATGKNPSMTAGMSPFPLIEEVRFALPSAYMTAATGELLAGHAGEIVSVRIDSETVPSTGLQPIGRIDGRGSGRMIVAAHIDTKPGTPGALDNASGVAVMLAAAELLAQSSLPAAVEFVPFNGEDHVLAPGEQAYLAEYGEMEGVHLMVNIDGAGLAGGPSAYSLYGVGESISTVAAQVAAREPHVVNGTQWPASDHMIFAMQGVPSMAITSSDFATASADYAHTPKDTPQILDYDVLAATARFIAEFVAGL